MPVSLLPLLSRCLVALSPRCLAASLPCWPSLPFIKISSYLSGNYCNILASLASNAVKTEYFVPTYQSKPHNMKKWAVLIVLSSILVANCRFTGKRIKGNGQVVTENRSTGSFEGISSSGSFDVYVAIGSPASVKIEAESNILPYIETYVDQNMLKVRTKGNVWLRPRRSLKIFVTAPRLTKIYSDGSGDIIGQTPIVDPSKLDVSMEGNGNIKLDVDAPEVKAKLTGNGGIQLKGQSKTLDCNLTGNGNIKAFDLMAEQTKVRILGNGDAEVFASVKLDVSVAGNGNVRYKGNAQASTHITGNGNISRVN
jgi:hypothetical protein